MLTRVTTLAAAVLLVSSTAHGESDRKRADAAARRGVAAYNLGDYEDAIAEFELAYRLVPDGSLLFNLGQAHRKLGHCEEALRFYKLYVNGRPDPTLVDVVNARITELTEACAVKEAAPGAVIEDGAPVPAVESPPPPVVAVAPVEAEIEEEVEIEPEEILDTPRWFTVSAGAASLRTGGRGVSPFGARIGGGVTRPVGDFEGRGSVALDLAFAPWSQYGDAGTTTLIAPWVSAGLASPRARVTPFVDVGFGVMALLGLGPGDHPMARPGRRLGEQALMPAARVDGGVEWDVRGWTARAELAVWVAPAVEGMAGGAIVYTGLGFGVRYGL